MKAKWMNKKFYYQTDDGNTYSATIVDYLILFLFVFALIAIVSAVVIFGSVK